VTVIDGATGMTTTVTDPNALSPTAVAVNPLTNKVYVANFGNYGSNRGNITVIDGATNTTTTVTGPNEDGPIGVAVNPVSNRAYVVNYSSNNITVIDGASNSTFGLTNVNAFAQNPGVVNPISNKFYVPNGVDHNGGSDNTTVISEQQIQRNPAKVKIQPLAGNRTNDPTPTFTFTAIDHFGKVDGVLFQVDTWQGEWTAAAPQASGQWRGTVQEMLQKGGHILYAYETDGQEATSTNTGDQSSPIIGNMTAYEFLEY
jgi:DNA-binding beta-propeller fold protein YncE